MMIYILEEYYDGKWWTISAHPSAKEAAEAMFLLYQTPMGVNYKLRIRKFEPEEGNE